MSATIPAAILESVATLFPTPTVPPAQNDVQVHDGEIRGIPANRYLLMGIGNELRSASSVDGVHRDYSGTFTVTSVAMNPDSHLAATYLARNLARRVRDHFVGRKLAVDGLELGPIVHTFSQIPQKDDDITDRVVMFVVDEYAVLATA